MRGGGPGRIRRVVVRGAAALAVAYLLLLVPDRAPVRAAAAESADAARARPFAWQQDAYWERLEEGYARARAVGCEAMGDEARAELHALADTVERLGHGTHAPDAPLLAEAEARVFDAAVRVAACPKLLPDAIRLAARLRDAVKRQSERWDPRDRRAREALYRVLYGSRAAIEEAILQAPPDAAPPELTAGVDEPSATPSALVHGVRVHSGDVLLSRGGAATSALIARGNDFPGNFSHVALVHVEPGTGRVRLVEAHIERGVAIATPDEYLGDRKLRVLVLRPRADLPAMAADPMLPHAAATAALVRAEAGPIAYDFAMDAQDPTRLFCSEVAAQAYRQLGVELWPAPSHVSSPGVRAWLAALGVRHFETLEPADLEDDPQLRVVAEWRDVEALRNEHLDNAATDAMLAAAEAGAPLPYSRWRLPFARVAKAWSAALNAFGEIGPVPQGMSATAALRSQWFTARHARLRARIEARAAEHLAARGYPPPYWRLVQLAKEELAASPD
ncbi:YiiX/YebB-like N1pC/P60 family cysteine hydrolase [Anaeromyxobacter oryzisoli]|uniref:YiiX/YebB-like N1pC/P60 family cysteine hydrolase n=1 Tax=Anaeromyxobacter oryzisoli TaxID=2925408 RepID=UPI001F586DD1|nr:YiiX/YebB-like N1pC/P60 family cysteine hydrolase [Anaeromyxobacter sp. SG63]